MFNLFNRRKNQIHNPAILLCSVGDAPFETEDLDIYQPYPNITQLQTNSLDELKASVEGKTFDIVHLFVNFAPDGTTGGNPGIAVLQLLAKVGCKLVLFASDNSVESYIAAFPQKQRVGVDNMHFILTLDRKGDNFPSFFKAIFELMAQGKSLPMAWVKLAPQHDGPWMDKMPNTIFEARQGHLLFVP